MRSIRYILSCDRGMTLIELLVATTIGLLVTALTAGVILSNRELLMTDLARTELNQNLRISLDLVGTNIRQAGENLPAIFPAVEVINGANGDSDELILRRNLLDEVLTVCADYPGYDSGRLYFAVESNVPVPGCVYTTAERNYTAWNDYLMTASGATYAYVFNQSTKALERITFQSVNDTGSEYYASVSGGVSQSYPAGGASCYVLEEWHFRLSPAVQNRRTLQLVVNGDEDNVMDVVDSLTDFQVTVTSADGVVMNSFGPSDKWTRISQMEVRLTGTESYRDKDIIRTLTARYYPRNILSN